MITNLKVTNFQRHKQAELQFVPGVNVIAGDSDSGKSSLIRALMWVLTNKPQGLGFRSWNCDKGEVMSVSIDLDNGNTITRRRSEQVNEYLLNSKKFVAMKTDVPSDILEAHGLEQVNLQSQFQSHYLLAASSGEVAKTLNTACDLTIIDTTIKAVNTIISQAKTAAQVATKCLSKAQDSLDELSWVPQAEVQIEFISAEMNRILQREQQFDEIYGSVVTLGYIDIDLGYFAKKQPLYEQISLLTEQDQAISQDSKHARALMVLLDELQSIDVKLDKTTDLISEDELAALKNLEKSYARDVVQQESLCALLDSLQEIQSELKVAKRLHKNIAVELGALWNETAICPLCGQETGG